VIWRPVVLLSGKDLMVTLSAASNVYAVTAPFGAVSITLSFRSYAVAVVRVSAPWYGVVTAVGRPKASYWAVVIRPRASLASITLPRVS
jgi:hypothetical protein